MDASFISSGTAEINTTPPIIVDGQDVFNEKCIQILDKILKELSLNTPLGYYSVSDKLNNDMIELKTLRENIIKAKNIRY